jgi:hypothetical protein
VRPSRIVPLVLAFASLALLGPGCVRTWLFTRLPQPLLDPMEALPEVGSLSAETCRGCHPEIAAEWEGSRMAQAWTDPVFVADRAENHELYACAYCHTPLVEQRPEVATGLVSLKPIRAATEPNPRFDATLQAEGVTCVACHQREGAMEGPHEVTAPHPTRVVPDSDASCATCHQVPEPPLSRLERAISDTSEEHRAWKAATGRTESCADCHMPRVTRPLTPGGVERPSGRHTFPGAWDEGFVRSGLKIGEAAPIGGRLTVTLTNLAGHRFPTSDPARALVIRARVGEDVREVVVARRVRLPALVDEGDTSLLPGETRTLDLGPVGTEGGAVVSVSWEPLRFASKAVHAAAPGSGFQLDGETGVR